mgnify:CR=1 FL=1
MLIYLYGNFHYKYITLKHKYSINLKYSIYAITFFDKQAEFWYVQRVRDIQRLQYFGNRLRELRKAKNLTQEDLSDLSGLTLSQIARIETGRVNTTICTVYILAEALKIQPGELLN